MNFWPFRRRVDDPIDRLIKPPVYKYVGHKEALEVKARLRREQADKIRRAATLIETTDRVPLRRIK